MKWLMVLGIAVCLAVALSITTGCEGDSKDDLPEPTGSGVLTGRWDGSLTVAVGPQWERTTEKHWSISHEGSSVTIAFIFDFGSLGGEQVCIDHAAYNHSSRILTTESWGKFQLSADNNVLAHYPDSGSGSLVRR